MDEDPASMSVLGIFCISLFRQFPLFHPIKSIQCLIDVPLLTIRALETNCKQKKKFLDLSQKSLTSRIKHPKTFASLATTAFSWDWCILK